MIDKAITALKEGQVYDMRTNKVVAVVKICCMKNDLILRGYVDPFRIKDYGKTWILVGEHDELR